MTVWWWAVAKLWLTLFWVEFACSLHACVGFLQVLWTYDVWWKRCFTKYILKKSHKWKLCCLLLLSCNSNWFNIMLHNYKLLLFAMPHILYIFKTFDMHHFHAFILHFQHNRQSNMIVKTLSFNHRVLLKSFLIVCRCLLYVFESTGVDVNSSPASNRLIALSSITSLGPISIWHLNTELLKASLLIRY